MTAHRDEDVEDGTLLYVLKLNAWLQEISTSLAYILAGRPDLDFRVESISVS